MTRPTRFFDEEAGGEPEAAVTTGRTLTGAARCPNCGERPIAQLFEIWSPREFMLDTCCEHMLAAANEFLAEDPKAAAKWLNEEGLGEICGQRVGLADAFGRGARRVIDDGCGSLVIDWHLELAPISQATAKDFIRTHHRHANKPPAGWRFGAGVMNGSDLVAVVMVGRPVARMLDDGQTVEVNRLCTRPDIAPGLAWNACSQLYAWSAKEARRRGFRRCVTYTLEEELGTSLKAAGWVVETASGGGSWNRPSRRRGNDGPQGRKLRWAAPGMGTRTAQDEGQRRLFAEPPSPGNGT